MGILWGADHGIVEGIRKGITEGIIYGALMAGALGWFHKRRVRQLGEGEDVTPWQTLELDILGPSLQAVFVRVLEAVKHFGANVKSSSAEKGEIHARVHSSWQSFGEYLDVTIKHVEDTRYSVTVTSRPRFRWTIIDYGKGRQNVRAIAHWLSMG